MTKDKDEGGLDRRAIRAQINENLKRVYSATLNEDLPDRFRELLDQLKAKDGSGPGGAK